MSIHDLIDKVVIHEHGRRFIRDLSISMVLERPCHDTLDPSVPKIAETPRGNEKDKPE